MEFKLLRAAVDEERRHWLAALEQLPLDRRDVYFLPEYLQAYLNSPDITACCAVYKNGEAMLLYPFLQSRIPRNEDAPHAENLQDIQSAYGYGGPVVNVAGEDPRFLQEAWRAFSAWCAAQQIVSEFVRFHPLLDNVRWAPQSMKTFQDRLTVPIMLQSYESAMRDTSYYRVHRQMLSKAERMGFSFHALPALSELSWFVPLYQETQDFLRAGSETRFGMDYFKALADGFGDRSWLGVVKQSDTVAAAALVLEGPAYLHSHLMGYRRDIPTAGMTNLLYHGISVAGASRGKAILHMGGGRTANEQDSLFRFKESLSPERAGFWLGTLCHDQLQYDALALEWENKNGPRPKNYFQFYRLPVSEPA
jgi:hypothetical protein